VSENQVLIAGAGIAAVECALALRALAGSRVELELLAPAAELVHRPSSVETPFGGPPAARIDLAGLAGEIGIRLHHDALAAVEPERHVVVTRDGDRIPYELLVVALGARSREAIPGAVTFRGPMSAGQVEQAIARVAATPHARLTFAAPPGARWLLPLYELALLGAAALRDRGVARTVVVATPEHQPLEVLGPAASEAIRGTLDRAGIELVTSAAAESAFTGGLRLASGEVLQGDVVVALPELIGPRIEGLPRDEQGFLPVDEHGRVTGCPDVFAAGDATAFAVKHGSLAAQQADAIAEFIAARAGAVGMPEPVRLVLRALVLTGEDDPLYLRVELGRGGPLPASGVASTEPLWSPPGKIAGRYLAPFLASGTVGSAPLRD